MPAIFSTIQERGGVTSDEMYRVFNMGIGLVFVVSPYYAESVQQQIAKGGGESWIVGRTAAGNQSVAWSS